MNAPCSVRAPFGVRMPGHIDAPEQPAEGVARGARSMQSAQVLVGLIEVDVPVCSAYGRLGGAGARARHETLAEHLGDVSCMTEDLAYLPAIFATPQFELWRALKFQGEGRQQVTERAQISRERCRIRPTHGSPLTHQHRRSTARWQVARNGAHRADGSHRPAIMQAKDRQ